MAEGPTGSFGWPAPSDTVPLEPLALNLGLKVKSPARSLSNPRRRAIINTKEKKSNPEPREPMALFRASPIPDARAPPHLLWGIHRPRPSSAVKASKKTKSPAKIPLLRRFISREAERTIPTRGMERPRTPSLSKRKVPMSKPTAPTSPFGIRTTGARQETPRKTKNKSERMP